ncbi:hypothetical protein [Muricomes intestini]|mgnify:CR=1 FL=1|jgi:hypothetical protein|uniref:hypothetical protein n=1 Tax=Muricomes intestini TaxID=1796634 RepID=UPI002FDF023A
MSKAISNNLRKAKSYQAQKATLLSWSEDWYNNQSWIVRKLKQATSHRDYGEILHMIDQLNAVTEKHFSGLNTISKVTSDPDRKLKDMRQEKAIEHPPVPENVELAADNECAISQGEMIDEIKKSYTAGLAINEIARWSNINSHKVVKILVTAGVYDSETYNTIKDLRIEGKTEEEISKFLGLSKAAMNDYTPYKKGLYNMEIPSENALKLRKYRMKWKD